MILSLKKMGANTYLSHCSSISPRLCGFFSFIVFSSQIIDFILHSGQCGHVHTITLIRQYLKTTTDTLDSMLVSF